jgi:hypothetical protein
MCGATSGNQDRVIEKHRSFEEKTMLMAQEPFVAAEVEYRLARATKQHDHPHGRRHRVPRRPTLHLPRPRRRPLSLA